MESTLQLMLMMLARLRAEWFAIGLSRLMTSLHRACTGKGDANNPAADAGDACRACSGQSTLQLMLLMLAQLWAEWFACQG